MVSPQLKTLNQQLREFRNAVVGDKSLEERRAGSAIMATFGTDPAGVATRDLTAGFNGLWHQPADGAPAGVILYAHGGGGSLGSARTHAKLVSHLVAGTGCAAMNLDYRLAPEHPFPAALDDIIDAYRWLLAEGFSPDRIAVGGDSLGGALALGTLVRLRDSGQPLPAAAVLLSPWVDLALTSESLRTRADRDLLADFETFGLMRNWYLDDTAPDDPIASPLYSDLMGLPPLHIQVSDEEVLVDDSKRLAAKADEAGVVADLTIYRDVPHVFQLWAGNVPEADEAIRSIVAFIRQQIGVASPSTA